MFVLGIAITAVAAVSWPRLYRSEALILYREGMRSSEVGGLDSHETGRRAGLRLREILLSYSSLSRIVKEIKPFPASLSPDDAIAKMRPRIGFRMREGDTFAISYEGRDPKTVQAVTARLAQTLLDEEANNKSEQITAMRRFLAEQGKRDEEELRRHERAVAEFLIKHPEFVQETLGLMAASRGSSKSSRSSPAVVKRTRRAGVDALGHWEREAVRLEAQLRYAPSGPSAPKESHRPGEADVRAAERALQIAREDLESKRLRFTEVHPDVALAKAREHMAEEKLSSLQQALSRGEDATVVAPSSSSERKAIEEELSRVQAKILEQRSRRTGSTPTPATEIIEEKGHDQLVALETEWARLNRELTEARLRHRQLEEKVFKAEIAADSLLGENSLQTVKIKLVDPAYLPTKSIGWPRSRVAMIGGGTSLFFAVMLMLGFALFSRRIYHAVDVQWLVQTPLLTVIPATEDKARARTPSIGSDEDRGPASLPPRSTRPPSEGK